MMMYTNIQFVSGGAPVTGQGWNDNKQRRVQATLNCASCGFTSLLADSEPLYKRDLWSGHPVAGIFILVASPFQVTVQEGSTEWTSSGG
eukprot:9341568-Karenia_brevis.AAC.1